MINWFASIKTISDILLVRVTTTTLAHTRTNHHQSSPTSHTHSAIIREREPNQPTHRDPKVPINVGHSKLTTHTTTVLKKRSEAREID